MSDTQPTITPEVGKRYVTRGGWITPPLQALTHDVFKFGIAPDFVVLHSWKADGTAPFGKKENDLVAEAEVQP
jgi:hypothetical protein